MAVARNRTAINREQDVSGMNAGPFRGSALCHHSGLDDFAGLDPGTTVVWRHPLSLLLHIEPAEDEQSNG